MGENGDTENGQRERAPLPWGSGAARDPKPCYGTDVGAEYDIELLERWDEDSMYTRTWGGPYPYGAGCGPDFDIWEGDRVRVVVESHATHVAWGCKGAVFRPSSPEQHGWEISASRSQAGPGLIFVGQFDARDCPDISDGCGEQFVVQIHPVE